MWEPSGCCCFTLRTGSLILASLMIGFGLVSMMYYIDFFVKTDIDILVENVCKEEQEIQNCQSIMRSAIIGFVSTRFIIDFIQVTFSILLVHGIRKNKTRFMIPYMIMLLIGISLLILLSLVLIVLLLVMQYWQFALIAIIIFGSITFLETYFLLVIRALFLQLKREKGQAHMCLKEEKS